MNQARSKKVSVLQAQSFCIFCGGNERATTVEHCPPRSLFDGRNWPEGFAFSACAQCNGGTSDEDLLVSFLSQMDPLAQGKPVDAGVNLYKSVKRQLPNILRKMPIRSATEARRAARSLGIRPEPGETYLELPLVRIPPEIHVAIKIFGSKLTKAAYFMETNMIFPATGSIMIHWFTNTVAFSTSGNSPALDVFSSLEARKPILMRNGNDLSSQFGLRISIGEEQQLCVVQAVFRRSFGFVTIASSVPGQVDEFIAAARKESTKSFAPFEKI